MKRFTPVIRSIGAATALILASAVAPLPAGATGVTTTLTGTYDFDAMVYCQLISSTVTPTWADTLTLEAGSITFTPLMMTNDGWSNGTFQIVVVGSQGAWPPSLTIASKYQAPVKTQQTFAGTYSSTANNLTLNVPGQASRTFTAFYSQPANGGVINQAKLYASFLSANSMYSCAQTQTITHN